MEYTTLFFSPFNDSESFLTCVIVYSEHELLTILFNRSYWRFMSELQNDVMPQLVSEIENTFPGAKFGK